MAKTLDQALQQVRNALKVADFDDPGQEARLLVGGLLGLAASEILSRGDRVLTEPEIERIEAALARRLAREPIFRILGRRAFRGLDLALSPGTLEPRPDTETLVEAVLPSVQARLSANGSCRILDLGTGTGAILLALLSEAPGAVGVGVDLSADALSTARRNAEAHGLSARTTMLESDWFAEISGQFDVIVSNPPYIPSKVIDGLEPEVRNHDPLAALDGGADGLDAYRIIAGQSRRFLGEAGLVGLEIGYDQKDSVSHLFEAEGFRLMAALRDLAGHDRVLLFTPA
ncbi:peptide chain release factor N(5)-glutamine methyltransferase [Rhizobium sp. YIM 134829]|uniref:peptide chain release factor N(5)-glutamine methyltransferase n=1 Tax=Rhizobium sp. YIM 134829 TaxID=3390453 RepID=UPI00397B1F7B